MILHNITVYCMHSSTLSNAFFCLVGLHVDRLYHLDIEAVLTVGNRLLLQIFYVEAVEPGLFLFDYAA